MASQALTIISLLSFFLLCISGADNSTSTTADFIKTKCKSTTYPTVCFQSLSTYASTIQTNPTQLARTALAVSLEKAQFNKAFIAKLNRFRGLKPREYAALKDCLELAGDGVDRLSQSLEELRYLNRARGLEVLWHINNAQTWVSASITDYYTCSDGFSGPEMNWRIQKSIQARMTYVSQVTSNALAFINQLADE